MTLVASGQIAMDEVNTELGRSATAECKLGDASESALAGLAGGVEIGMDGLYSGTKLVMAAGGSTTRGYLKFSYGTLNPATHRGTEVWEVSTNTGTGKLVIILNALVAQSYFERVITSIGTYLTNAATYTQPGGQTKWEWNYSSAFTSGNNYNLYFNT